MKSSPGVSLMPTSPAYPSSCNSSTAISMVLIIPNSAPDNDADDNVEHGAHDLIRISQFGRKLFPGLHPPPARTARPQFPSNPPMSISKAWNSWRTAWPVQQIFNIGFADKHLHLFLG
ncbi:MAG: hypothetical protein U5L96_17960 [Owenweeksia sp.]|nr:hypothetical protein [Owenweeksia sp.]